MPAATASLGRPDRDLPADHDDFARLEAVGAENGARHLGPPGAHQPGEAEDLACAEREAHVPDQRRRS